MPFTWIIITMLVVVFTKNEKRRRRASVIVCALLIFFSNPFIVNEAWLIWEESPKPIHSLPAYDAAILLTGFTNLDKSPHDRIYTNKGADRVLHTIQLYRAGKIEKIIISGGSGSLLNKYATEADEVKHILLQAGISKEDILLEGKSRNTYEGAQMTKVLLESDPTIKQTVLVTSAFHMRRSKGCFEKAGIRTDTFSADFYSTDRSFTLNKFLPSEKALYEWHKLIHEMAGYIVYIMMGYC
jgi:uncharacterized SAM-binding protein YcdF (DUF218 family)